MSNKSASDILLEMSLKIDSMFHMIKSQDLNIKVLSNKLNSILANAESSSRLAASSQPQQQSAMQSQMPVQVEVQAVPSNEETNVFISSEDQIPIDNVASGIRRTSREDAEPEFSEVPMKNINSENGDSTKISVLQRVIDQSSKTIFLAEIEIFDEQNNVTKTRTNSVGKWSASLAPGNYKVVVRKRDKNTKAFVEGVQNITVKDGNSMSEFPPFTLKR